ncbi:hypothetical protein VV02_03560 [Luteipulveratus mongoliensis]|uniref:Aromatic ring-opening dioxygenase LigA n=1 Tax=Luteipulveratus mongoliensis TaxID=571913 RepID=A0A0K1JPG7_9MICO|nr:hypothetical protein VV02_03560 [Luteipulveratus mongoliensis]
MAPAQATPAPSPESNAARFWPVVPGAVHQVKVRLGDLTTAGTVTSGHTDPADWAGLEAPGTTRPSGVPGIQIDGYFPDTSTFNTDHGWNHDSQFVIRLPDHWNGGLVVAGPPGVRKQYASDRIIGDRALAQGYAYASTDKGNSGDTLYLDGKRPGDAIMEWNQRMTQLTRAAKTVVAQRYMRRPQHTYVAGLSAAGYLVRWQLENNPGMYDGGIDWNGLLFTPKNSLLSTLPPALRAYPRLKAGQASARNELLAAGYPATSEPTWGWHYANQWDFFQRVVREELDPSYDGDRLGGTPFCAEGTGAGCDTDYDLSKRPQSVQNAVRRVSLTGKLKRPLITLHGTNDALVPITRTSDVYDDMARPRLHRYYRIVGGAHVDGLAGAFPGVIAPMLPCFDAGFDALVRWTHGVRPPVSATVTPGKGTCAL